MFQWVSNAFRISRISQHVNELAIELQTIVTRLDMLDTAHRSLRQTVNQQLSLGKKVRNAKKSEDDDDDDDDYDDDTKKFLSSLPEYELARLKK